MRAGFISIKFDVKWILSKQTSGKSLVVDDALKAIKEKYTDDMVVIINKEFHQCRLIFAGGKVPGAEEISALLNDCIDDVACANMGIDVIAVEKEQLEDILINIKCRLSDTEQKFFADEFQIDLNKKDEKPAEKEEAKEEKDEKINIKEKDETYSEKSASVIDNRAKIEDLIGVDSFKEWISQTQKMAVKYGKLVETAKVFNNISYLISINRGNGLSTILSLMADTLKTTNFVEFAGEQDFVEWKLAYTDDPGSFPAFDAMLRYLEKVSVLRDGFKGIVAIDMEEWVDNLHDKRIDELLKFVVDKKDNMIFVFYVPYVDNSVLARLYARLDDVISTRVMKFVPPSDKQYFKYFRKVLNDYGMTVEDNAFNAFAMKIAAEKNDGRFYGFNTVRKIINEILYKLISESALNGTELTSAVTEQEIMRIYTIDENISLSGIEQLNGMVALKEVKNKVQEILSTVKLQKELHNKDNSQIKPCFHMMFTGNPGTGKTVVARIIGRIFKEEGLLQIGNFFEVSRKDFIGRFVGHTAPKTMEICRSAYGSVLFIDEAYMLADDRDGYSAEAIGTLIAEMENNRDKMVVIFAGYEKELEGLFDMNPGLRDRIPHKINFPNYNREELLKIFYMQLENKVKYDASFKSEADKFFADFPEDVLNTRNFSNGRFVRNLAERIISKAAMRFEMSKLGIDEFELTATDFSIAVSDADYQKLFGKVKHVTNTIGF